MCLPVAQSQRRSGRHVADSEQCVGFPGEEMALHGAAISCVDLLAATVPVQTTKLEPDVIRGQPFVGSETGEKATCYQARREECSCYRFTNMKGSPFC